MRVNRSPSCNGFGGSLEESGRRLLRRDSLPGNRRLRLSSRYHTEKILRLSQDLPIVIEVVEDENRIKSILPQLDEMVTGGLITLEKVHAILYRSSTPEDAAGKRGDTPGSTHSN